MEVWAASRLPQAGPTVLNVNTRTQVELSQNDYQDYVTFCSSHDQRFVYAGTEVATIAKWDTATHTVHRVIRVEQKKWLYSLRTSRDDSLLFAAHGDGWRGLSVWDTASGGLLGTLGSSSGARCLHASESTDHIVSGDTGGTMTVWSTAAMDDILTLAGDQSPVTSLTSDRSFEHIFSAQWNYYDFRIWDTVTGVCTRTVDAHSDEICNLAMSAGGRYLVSGSRDKTVRVWTLQGQLILTLKGHSLQVNSVAVTQDHRVFSVADDGTVKEWDITAGREVHTFNDLISCGSPMEFCVVQRGSR